MLGHGLVQVLQGPDITPGTYLLNISLSKIFMTWDNETIPGLYVLIRCYLMEDILLIGFVFSFGSVQELTNTTNWEHAGPTSTPLKLISKTTS